MNAHEQFTECLDCGEEISTDDPAVSPNVDLWSGIIGYFCNIDCHINAGEAYDQRRLEEN